MKVRLKHFVCLQRYRLALFQFHEGPIKTLLGGGALLSGIGFQFHEGPIKTVLLSMPSCTPNTVSIP